MRKSLIFCAFLFGMTGTAHAQWTPNEAYTGFVWSPHHMRIVDAWEGRISPKIVRQFQTATGVRVTIQQVPERECGSDRNVYRHFAKPGQVFVCNFAHRGNVEGWLDPFRPSPQRSDRAVLGMPAHDQSSLCHELGHAFGLGHWDDLALARLDFCTGGLNNWEMGEPDRLRLQAVYRHNLNFADATAWVEDRLGCHYDPDPEYGIPGFAC
jgi:hypothetical protein